MILSRNIDPVLLAALAGPRVYPAILVALDWPGGFLRFHSGRGTISWGGQVWSGVGPFHDVQIGEEGEGLASVDASIKLIGPLDAVLDDCEAVIKNRYAAIWTGLVTQPAGNVLIGQPFVQFVGTMDGIKYQQDGSQHGLVLAMTAGPGARVSASITHSAEDQIAKYPGDTAGRHVQLAQSNAGLRTWPA